jgi:hypothetical protein
VSSYLVLVSCLFSNDLETECSGIRVCVWACVWILGGNLDNVLIARPHLELELVLELELALELELTLELELPWVWIITETGISVIDIAKGD